MRIPLPCLLLVATACGGGTGGDAVVTPTSVTGISISSTSQSLNGLGSEVTLSVTLAPAGATATVVWSSENSAIATVTGAGLSAVVKAVGPGSTRIRAAVGSVETFTSVTVVPLVRRITFSTDTVRLAMGASLQLSPSIEADAGASQNVSWTSSAPHIATVSSSGMVTALSAGLAEVTVRSTAFSQVSATIPVKVALPAITVALAQPSSPVIAGTTLQLSPTVTAPAGVATTLTWISSATTVAAVSASGLVTAVSPGQSQVTATSTVNPASAATVTITVVAPTVRSIAVAPGNSTVFVGGTRALGVTIDADPGANTALTWTSSVPGIATVSSNGVVTGVSAGGPVTITARSTLVPTVSGTAQVTVSVPPASTQLTAARLGVAPYLSGWPSFSMASIDVSNAIVGTGIQGGGGGTFSNNLLHLRNGVLTDATPACCSRSGIPTQLAAESATKAMIFFSGDQFFGGGPPRTFVLDGTTWSDANYPATLANDNNVPAAIGAVGNGEFLVLTSRAALYRYSAGAWTHLADIDLASSFPTIGGMVAWHRDSVLIFSCDATNVPPRVVRWGKGTAESIASPSAGNNCSRPDGVRGDSLIIATKEGLGIWNGTQWRYVSNGLAVGDTLRWAAMCGTNRYALSQTLIVYQLQGNALQAISTEGEATALGAAVNAGIDCGSDGTLRVATGGSMISRRSNGAWIVENFAPSIAAVHMSSTDFGIMVGQGLIYRWNGIDWQLIRRTTRIRDSWSQVASWPNGRFIATGTVSGSTVTSLHYNGSTYTRTTHENLFNLRSLVAAGTNNAYVVSRATNAFDSEDMLLQFDGNNWNTVANIAGREMVVGATSASNVVVLGSQGYGRRFDGNTWQPFAGLPVDVIPSRIYVASADIAFAGYDCTPGNARIWRYSGGVWTEQNLPLSAGDFACMSSLFGTGPNDVYAIVRRASGLVVLHWNGATWSTLNTPAAFVSASRGSAVPGLTVFSGQNGFLGIGTPPAAPSAAALRMRTRRR